MRSENSFGESPQEYERIERMRHHAGTAAFVPFPKIGRLKRGMVITEKLDGTNAQVYIQPTTFVSGYDTQVEIDGVTHYIRAGSRNSWLSNGGTVDNYGFGRWVHANAHELAKLGEGRHFGEWWGNGIQRGYGLNEKRFSLFNTGRWYPHGMPAPTEGDEVYGCYEAPACCHVVPVLGQGEFETGALAGVLADLKQFGSRAAPGFDNPEGIIVFHSATRTLFKQTFEHDSTGKEAK